MKRVLLAIAMFVGIVAIVTFGLTHPETWKANKSETRVVDPVNTTTITVQTPVITEVEPEVVEPEKPLGEVQASAMQLLAESKYADAKGAFAEVLSRMNRRSLDAVPYLIGAAQVTHVLEQSGAGDLYREALAVVDRKVGPDSAAVLPVLRGLIAVHDDTEQDTDALTLVRRYARISAAQGPEHLSAISGSDASALLAPYIKAATEEGKVCSCKLQEQVAKAIEEHGERSYVVAMLRLEVIYRYDAEDDSPEEIATGENELRTILSIMDERLGPLDRRLRPVLVRLIAEADANGKYGDANMWHERLNLTKDAGK